MVQAKGILTAHGGLTSHAAVVARGMGTPCVTGCEALHVDERAKIARLPGHELKEGDTITIDGGTGEVIVGAVPLVPPQINDDFSAVLEWADGIRRLKVRTNADNPADAAKAREFGAEGIGLCRTEHMFADADRLGLMREMILAADEDGRRAALDRLLPIQQADFEGIFEVMAGLPVTIRLLDWPLHEFLPAVDEEQDEADARADQVAAGVEPDARLARVPARALLPGDLRDAGARDRPRRDRRARAVQRAARRDHAPARGFGEELKRLRELTVRVPPRKGELEYLVRDDDRASARLRARRRDRRARRLLLLRDERPDADGTRPLARRRRPVPLALPRDRRARADPFETIDQDGVGDLMEIAVERGRGARSDLKLGICGEHGGEAKSVAFCHRLGLDYVSCSPYRVPLARLAAAQAALTEQGIGAVAIGG